MSKSFEDVVGLYTNPSTNWRVSIGGEDFTSNLEYLEFNFSLNSPTTASIKTSGISGLNENAIQGEEVVIRKGTAKVFRGIVQKDESLLGLNQVIKASGYASELKGNKEKKYDDSDDATVTEIVNFLVDGTEIEVGDTTKTFSTSFDLSATVNVEDFRVQRKQLEDLNRLMGEYGLEWYITFDNSDNPVLNVTDGLIITQQDGSPMGTFKTSGPGQNARNIKQNTNRDKGDFEAVVVRGYGDGDDQRVSKAEKANIKSADKQNDSFTVEGLVTDEVSAGDKIIVESNAGILGGGEDGGNAGEYTVENATYDSNAEETTVEVNENVTDGGGGLLDFSGAGTLVYTSSGVLGDKRTKIYTDKTIQSKEQADKRALNLMSSRSVVWREIEVTPSSAQNIYSVGEVYKVEETDAKLNDKFRVIESYYKIRLDRNESESRLTLSNKPESFYDDFRNEQDTTRSQTDYMQGARNIWSDKEAANATNPQPLEIDFEVPEDVVDIANNNRLNRVEFNYACEEFKDRDVSTVEASNFDPSVKDVSSTVKSNQTQVEREKIKRHKHAVGSATSGGATEAQSSEVLSFNESISPSNWSRLTGTTGVGETLELDNIDDDLTHEIDFYIFNIDQPRDLQFAVLGSDDSATASFQFSPSNPIRGESVEFVNTSGPGPVQAHWDFGDGSTALGRKVYHSYSSAGSYTVELRIYEPSAGTSIAESDASNDQFIVNGQLLQPNNGDKVKVTGSDGNDGSYTVTNYNYDSGSDQSTVTVFEDVQYSYTGESTGNINVFADGASKIDTVTKTVSVVSAQSLSEEELKEKGELVEFEKGKVLVRDAENEMIGSQDKSSLQASFDLDEYGYIINDYNPPAGNYSWEVAVQDGDGGCGSTDVEDFLQKDNDAAFFEFQSESDDINICSAQTLTFLPEFDTDEDTPFDGAGKYSTSIRASHTGLPATVRSASDEFIIADRIVEDVDVTVDPQGDNSSEIRVDVDAWVGENIDELQVWVGDDDGSDTGSNPSEMNQDGIDSARTVELVVGESETIEVEFVDYDIELLSTSGGFDDEAELEVDGDNEGFFEAGDTVVDEGEVKLKVRDVTHDYEIEDKDGNTTGAEYSSVVLETYLDEYSEYVQGFSEGDYTCHIRFVDFDGDFIKDPFLATDYEHDDFTITLNNPPTAGFSFSPSNPGTFETVSFTDQSTDPDGNNTIQKWEWDFGDGTTRTINSAPGDTSHSYSSSGSYTVKLTVTDDKGASSSTTKTVTVGQTEVLDDTVVKDSEENVGGSPTSIASQQTELDNTVLMSSSNSVGSLTAPGSNNNDVMRVKYPIPIRDMSSKYQIYAATQGGSQVNIDGIFRIVRHQHTHDIPRQDDFEGKDADVGAGAENKEVDFSRVENNRGNVLLDFSSDNSAVTLDTTLNANNVQVTVGELDSNDQLINSEQLSANDGTDTGTISYDTEELFVRIDNANNTEDFELRDQVSSDRYTLAAGPESAFSLSKTEQEQEEVPDTDGDDQDIVENVSDALIAGQKADNVRIFIDSQPDSGGNTEQEITSDFYNNDTDGDGNIDSGKPKDKGLDLSDYVDSPGWYRLKIKPDKPSFIKSRVFLDHHKDTENGN
jgi:PKD repeat protein